LDESDTAAVEDFADRGVGVEDAARYDLLDLDVGRFKSSGDGGVQTDRGLPSLDIDCGGRCGLSAADWGWVSASNAAMARELGSVDLFFTFFWLCRFCEPVLDVYISSSNQDTIL
jgi:hypothetical protein